VATGARTAARIGILGGTFNPPHVAHLICAQEALIALDLDGVVWMPARVPPHKPVPDEPGIEHRLSLCRHATAEDRRFEVSDLEALRNGPSYTVDTLEQLKSTGPDTELFMIVGADVAAGLPSWHQAERVLEQAQLAVAARPGTARSEVESALAGLGGAERARFFPMPAVGVSSTMVRERVRAGRPIRYLVPDAVADYIYSHDLYGGSRT
jgi:nicotinate-nucleotide adenylyltransferase